MLSQVKEFFNKLQKKEDQEQKPNKKAKKNHRTVGILPYIEYDIPDITNFSHFIECEIAPNICPMMWESMEVDFDNESRRYCDYCQKYIYKADNQYMIEKLTSENKCMAVSSDLLEKINGKMDDDRYNNLQSRLNISKLFMYFKKYKPEEFYEMQEKKLSYEEQLKDILLFVLYHRDVEKYIALEIDMQTIYHIALEYSNDEEFSKMILDRIKNY